MSGAEPVVVAGVALTAVTRAGRDVRDTAQIVELVWQLAGRVGNRQVDDARVAIAENAGG